MKISICTFEKWNGREPGTIGSSMIRGKWIAEKWPEAKIWSNGQKADVMIFQKVYSKEMMTDFKGIKILDLCDPDWFSTEQTRCYINELSTMVDAITCSTQELVDFIKTFAKIPVVYIPDRLNLDYFTTKKQHTERAKIVVWFGYSYNAKEVLPRVLQSLKARQLNLKVISNAPFEPNEDFGVRIDNVVWIPENAYMEIQAGDMSINPPALVKQFRFKSNNKTLISWGLGLPVCNLADDMDRFLDPKEREKEVDIRRKEIGEKWDIIDSVKQYKDLICHIQKTKKNN